MYIKIKYSVFLLSVWYSQSSSIVNVFGIASGPGILQVEKKVVVTVGQFKDNIDEIQQSYELGFTPYRLQKNVHGVFVTAIRVYEGRVYVLDDVAPAVEIDIVAELCNHLPIAIVEQYRRGAYAHYAINSMEDRIT